jgi:hypothetical protein
MSSFIKTDEGLFILSSEIVEVRKRGSGRSVVKTKGDKVHIVSERPKVLVQKLEADSGLVIPAEPGYFVAGLSQAEETKEYSVRLFAVVGWSRVENKRFKSLFESLPIVAGLTEDIISWALVWPDGRVVGSPLSEHKNAEEWLESQRKKYCSGGSDEKIIDFPK